MSLQLLHERLQALNLIAKECETSGSQRSVLSHSIAVSFRALPVAQSSLCDVEPGSVRGITILLNDRTYELARDRFGVMAGLGVVE